MRRAVLPSAGRDGKRGRATSAGRAGGGGPDSPTRGRPRSTPRWSGRPSTPSSSAAGAPSRRPSATCSPRPPAVTSRACAWTCWCRCRSIPGESGSGGSTRRSSWPGACHAASPRGWRVGCSSRRVATAPQSELAAADRQANVRDAFEIRRPDEVRSRHVLLVDDLLTTGATAGACADCLREAGRGIGRGAHRGPRSLTRGAVGTRPCAACGATDIMAGLIEPQVTVTEAQLLSGERAWPFA